MRISTTSKITNNIHPLTLNMGEVVSFTSSFATEILKDKNIFKVSTLKTGDKKRVGTMLRLKTYLESSSFYERKINDMLMRKFK